MHLGEVQIVARIGDTGHLIGHLRRVAQRLKARPVEVAAAVVRRDHIGGAAEAFDVDGVGTELLGDIRARDDRAGRAVAVAAAVIQAKRRGDQRCLEHLIDCDDIVEMRLGAQRAVGVVLDGDLGKHGLALLIGQAVLLEIRLRDQGEGAGRVAARLTHGIQAATDAEAAGTSVLELLCADRHGDVAHTALDGEAGVDEGNVASRAPVLIAGDGNTVHLQRVRHRRTRAVVGCVGVGKVRDLDVLRADAGVLERLEGRLNDEVLQAGVPALAKLGAAHANDRYIIFKPVMFKIHRYTVSLLSGRTFQK